MHTASKSGKWLIGAALVSAVTLAAAPPAKANFIAFQNNTDQEGIQLFLAGHTDHTGVTSLTADVGKNSGLPRSLFRRLTNLMPHTVSLP
jgi:hypothetical protein